MTLDVQALGRALTNVIPPQGERIGGWYAADVAREYEKEAAALAKTPDPATGLDGLIDATYTRGFAEHCEDDPLRDFMATYFDHDDDHTRGQIIDFLDRIIRRYLAASATDEPYDPNDDPRPFLASATDEWPIDYDGGSRLHRDALAASATDEGRPRAAGTYAELLASRDALQDDYNALSDEHDKCPAVPVSEDVTGLRDAFDYLRRQFVGTPPNVDMEDAWAAERINEAEAMARAALAASATDEGPTAMPWLIRFTCCGRADGVAARATWAEADALRQSYVAVSGHERSAVIEDALAGSDLLDTSYHRRRVARRANARPAVPETLQERCPVCGTPGAVVSSDEGTSHFRPAVPEALDRRIVAKAVLLTNGFGGESIEPADLAWAGDFIRHYAALRSKDK